MAFADFTAYKDECEHPAQRIVLTKNSLTTIAGRASDLWVVAPFGGSTPTTAVVPTNTTTGAIGQIDGGGSALRLPRIELATAQPGFWVLCDRLSHQGGLDATNISAQTTNLATAALTRYTSGVGVMLGLTIYTQIGTTATTVTCSYTDDAGNAGQTTQPALFGATGFREASRLIICPLAAGDVGVRAVASVTVLASTGTVGNFGVTLFKPLIALPQWMVGSNQVQYDAALGLCANLPEIVDGACLFWMFIAQTTSSGILNAELCFTED